MTAMKIDPKLDVKVELVQTIKKDEQGQYAAEPAKPRLEVSIVGNYDGLQLLSLTLAEMLGKRQLEANVKADRFDLKIIQEVGHGQKLKEAFAARIGDSNGTRSTGSPGLSSGTPNPGASADSSSEAATPGQAG